MGRLLQEPDIFTVRADGATHVLLRYTRETALALGVEGVTNRDGSITVSYRLRRPEAARVPVAADCN